MKARKSTAIKLITTFETTEEIQLFIDALNEKNDERLRPVILGAEQILMEIAE